MPCDLFRLLQGIMGIRRTIRTRYIQSSTYRWLDRITVQPNILLELGTTATQYALFSSLMTLPGKFFGGFSGVLVDAVGYSWFFVYAAVTGFPAVFLVLFLIKHRIATQKVV